MINDEVLYYYSLKVRLAKSSKTFLLIFLIYVIKYLLLFSIYTKKINQTQEVVEKKINFVIFIYIFNVVKN